MRDVIAAIAIVLSLAQPARAQDWNDGDRALFATAMLLHVLDWGQTLHIVDDPRFYERNPILGRHPSRGDVNAYFAGTALLMFTLAHVLPEYRRPLLWGYVAVGATVVGQNFGIGLRVRF